MMQVNHTGCSIGMREPPLLEQWYRDHLHRHVIDISSSGVPPLTVAQTLQAVGLTCDDLGAILLADSESLGSPALREAIAAAWGNGDARNVLAAQGSNEAIFLVLHALLEPGDEVVSAAPIYHAYESVLRDRGCAVRWWPLRPEAGFRPDLDELDTLVSPATKAIIVNFPHNPTGATVTAREQDRIVEIAQRAGSYLVWDNALAELTYDGPPLQDVTGIYERGLSIGTLSKAYGLPGLRVGWCLAPADVLNRTIPLRDSTTLFLSSLVETIATAAVCNRQVLRSHHAARLRTNRRLLLEWAVDRPEVAHCPEPAGGVTAFVQFRGVTDTIAMCTKLAHDGVLLVPGAAFGSPDRVRLGFGGETADLSAGLDKIIEFLAA